MLHLQVTAHMKLWSTDGVAARDLDLDVNATWNPIAERIESGIFMKSNEPKLLL